MSVLTGPHTEIYADTTIPGTSAVAMTAFKAHGNSVKLRIKTTTGGCGSLTFTAEESVNGTDYCSVIDRDSAWSFATTLPTTAGDYVFDLEGLDCVPGVYYRLSYQAATAAGKLQVYALNWENPKGGGISVSVPDVVVDVGNIDVNIENVENQHDTAVTAYGFQQLEESKVFDGAVLPGAVGTEGDAVRPAASLQGVRYVMPVNKDGSGSPLATHDTAIATGVGTECMIAGAEAESIGAVSVVSAEGDATRLKASLSGVLHTDLTDPTGAKVALVSDASTARAATDDVLSTQPLDAAGQVLGRDAANTARSTATLVNPAQLVDATGKVAPAGEAVGNAPFTKVTDGTNTAAVIGTINSLKADLSSVAGTVTSVTSGNKDNGTQRVTLATDDINAAAIKVAVELMDDWDDGADHCEVVDPYKPTVATETGSGAMSKSIAITAPTELLSIEMKMSAAPTTGAQPITVTKDANAGAAYDVVHLSADLVALANTSYSARFNPPIYFVAGDAIVVAFVNTDAVTYGLQVITRQV
jgi:hypothetical protein